MSCTVIKCLSVLVLAGGVAASDVRIKLGLATIPGTFRYSTLHASTGAFTGTSSPFRLGSISVHGEVLGSLGGGFEAGVEIGGGIPFQKPALDHTVMYEPAPGGANILAGDSSIGIVTPVPLLAKIGWGAPLGPGDVGLTIGGGMLLVFVSSRTTDQWWNTPLGPGAMKLTPADSEFARVTTWTNDSLALPVIQAAPAYRLDLGGGHRIGLEVPVGYLGRRSLNGARTDPLALTSATSAASPVTELGGFVWNVLLVYTRTAD